MFRSTPRKVLVTGGAGFIGSHLVERLLEAGDEVWVVDDLSTGRLANLEAVRSHPSLHLVVDSIMNWPLMDDVVGQVEAVYHLAAAVGVRKIMEEPVATITTNVRGTEIVLDCCHRHGAALFLASTSEIYGKGGERLHEEHDRIMGSTSRRRWAYACTKVLDEFLALAYHQERGLPVVVGRFFNTVGPRQSGQWGMVVPRLVEQALAGDPLTVYGTGEQRRSFLHVDDAVRAVVGLMERKEALGQVYNIGSEAELAILALAERVKGRTGSSSPVQLIPYEQAYGEGFEDMERRQPDTTKLRRLLDWAPTKGIDAIIDEVAADLTARPAVTSAGSSAG